VNGRRAWLRWMAMRAAVAGSLPFSAGVRAQQSGDAPAVAVVDRDTVRRGRVLRFPADHGAHPGTRIEWWYLTGWLRPADAAVDASPTHGFQVTFFRSRTGIAEDVDGRFAPRQILFAHAALTSLGAGGDFRHDQRMARWDGRSDAATGHAALGDLDVQIGRWSMRRGSDDALHTAVQGQGAGPDSAFDLQITAAPTQPMLIQGDRGYSRKGPLEAQASHYYSLVQLQVSGALKRAGAAGGRAGTMAVAGTAWLDHEWSNTLMPPESDGWDWIGMNLFDGSALTAFRLRRRAKAGAASAPGSGDPNEAAVWAGGSWRDPSATTAHALSTDEVSFEPLEVWTSPVTGGRYPVSWRVLVGERRFQVRALRDAQELDSRAGVGTVYWEGLSELLDESGNRVGLGYLEMTGYVGRLRL